MITAKKRKKVTEKRFSLHGQCPIYTEGQTKEIAECIKEIKNGNDREIKPIDVLIQARDREHRLHKYFEWDDSKAAEKYRLAQARTLIRHVYVIINTPGGPKTTRYMVSVKSKKKKGRQYVSFADALNEDEYRGQMIREALTQLQIWRRKFGMYEELMPIFKAIDSIKV